MEAFIYLFDIDSEEDLKSSYSFLMINFDKGIIAKEEREGSTIIGLDGFDNNDSAGGWSWATIEEEGIIESVVVWLLKKIKTKNEWQKIILKIKRKLWLTKLKNLNPEVLSRFC